MHLHSHLGNLSRSFEKHIFRAQYTRHIFLRAGLKALRTEKSWLSWRLRSRERMTTKNNIEDLNNKAGVR